MALYAYSSSLYPFLLIVFIFINFLSVYCIDTTIGFTDLPMNSSYYRVQRPYNVAQDKRYQFAGGVHKMWVFADDKPHSPFSHTKPRTEIGIEGYSYSSGIWQFEGYGYVPQGTSGACIMQIFGARPPYAANLMLYVYNGTLMYYREIVIADDIYNRWFRLNVIHHVRADKLKIFVNGNLTLKAKGRGRTIHTFKYGVYAQSHDSYLMESYWTNIRVLEKTKSSFNGTLNYFNSTK